MNSTKYLSNTEEMCNVLTHFFRQSPGVQTTLGCFQDLSVLYLIFQRTHSQFLGCIGSLVINIKIIRGRHFDFKVLFYSLY